MNEEGRNNGNDRFQAWIEKHIFALLNWLIFIAAFLALCLYLSGYFILQNQIEEKFANLTKAETKSIIALNEGAELPGTAEARKVADLYEKRQAAEKKKWLAAQKKRVAKAKAKAEAKEKKKRIEEEAWENTRRTWSGSGWNGMPLTKGRGTITGPSGKETYYNLNMEVCVRIMRNMGFSEAEYPYEVRSDGVKTLGGYVMVAANLRIRPKGSFIMTSCGVGIVVDTGGFARNNPTQLDLAVAW